MVPSTTTNCSTSIVECNFWNRARFLRSFCCSWKNPRITPLRFTPSIFLNNNVIPDLKNATNGSRYRRICEYMYVPGVRCSTSGQVNYVSGTGILAKHWTCRNNTYGMIHNASTPPVHWKKGGTPPTQPPTHPRACTMYSRTTAVVLQQQQQHVQHPTHRPRWPMMYVRAAQCTTAIHEYVHAEVVSASYWNYHVFTISRLIGDRGRLLSTLRVCRVLVWGTFFRQSDYVVPCAAGVARITNLWATRKNRRNRHNRNQQTERVKVSLYHINHRRRGLEKDENR